MNATRPLQCAKILGISRLVLRMRSRERAGAVVIEKCAAASFQQRGLEWAKKRVHMNRQRAVKPVELQPLNQLRLLISSGY